MCKSLSIAAAIGALALLCGCVEFPPPEATIKPPVDAAQRNASDISPAHFIVQLLPAGSKPIVPPNTPETVQWRDIEGDGTQEGLIIYEEVTAAQQKQLKVALFQKQNETWRQIWNIASPGFALDYAGFADISGDKLPELLLGWSLGVSAGKGLDVYLWQDGSMELLGSLNYDTNLVIEDMPTDGELDERVEIAVWHEEVPDIHRVEVVRWKDGQFVTAEDVYPYYFKKVERHYTSLVENPDMKMHPYIGMAWYYLADAQMKAWAPNPALVSIRRGKQETVDYPSEEQFDQLERQVRESPAYFLNNSVEGIGKADAIDYYGDQYVIEKSMSGEEIWRYDIGVRSGYTFPKDWSGIEPDFEGIGAGDVKLQFFITWNSMGLVKKYEAWYWNPSYSGHIGGFRTAGNFVQ